MTTGRPLIAFRGPTDEAVGVSAEGADSAGVKRRYGHFRV